MTLSLRDRPDTALAHLGQAELRGADRSAPTAVAAAGRPSGRQRPAARVLVVDDVSSIRTELRALLEDAGFAVVGEASHGAEGVALARELRPDVVVMDLRMPILDGIAATAHITRDLPDTRVVVLSAFDDPSLEESARAAGARRFLTKGSSPAAIAAAVRDAAGTSR